MRPSFAVSVAFWLRAYPLRWRAVRADEVTAVLADLAGPDAQRLDRRTALGLLRGGCATRWRGHPPLHTYLAYRWLNVPVPERYRAWVQDDVLGPGYRWRASTASLAWLAVVALIDPVWWAIWAMMLAVLVGLAFDPVRTREAALRRQLEPTWRDTGNPVVVTMQGPRERASAQSQLRRAAVGAAVVAALWSMPALAQAGGWWPVLAVAVGLGAVVALVAAGMLRRRHESTQPARVLVASSYRDLVAAGWCALAAGLAVAELSSGWWPTAAVVVAAVALAVTPVLVVGWAWSCRHGDGLSGTDVARAMTGQPPLVDEPEIYRRVVLAPPASHPSAAVGGALVWSVDSRPTPIATPHQGAHPWDESSST